jgi:hypothetical protein
MSTELMNLSAGRTQLSVELVEECLIYAENELTALYSAVIQLFGFEQAQLTMDDWLSELEAMEWPAESPIPNWRRTTLTAVSRLADRVGGHGRLYEGRSGGCRGEAVLLAY